MTFFSLNLVLAVIWMFLTGSFEIFSFASGAVFGFFILWAAGPLLGARGYTRSVFGAMKLLAIFLWELVVANLQLARDILSVRPALKPGFVSFEPEGLSPGQTVLLGNMISLTPGTLTVDTDRYGKMLYIHTIYAQDPAKLEEGFRLFTRLIRGAWGEDLQEPREASP